jgi:hypothetical protein
VEASSTVCGACGASLQLPARRDALSPTLSEEVRDLRKDVEALRPAGSLGEADARREERSEAPDLSIAGDRGAGSRFPVVLTVLLISAGLISTSLFYRDNSRLRHSLAAQRDSLETRHSELSTSNDSLHEYINQLEDSLAHSPVVLYDHATEMLKVKNYSSALLTFEQIVTRHPQSLEAQAAKSTIPGIQKTIAKIELDRLAQEKRQQAQWEREQRQKRQLEERQRQIEVRKKRMEERRSLVPTGASARCRDGTFSFSRSRRGTCSHHGGVAQWF